MNAASILNYFLKKKIIDNKKLQINKIIKQIGSDVIFGMQKKISILKGSGVFHRSNIKLNLYLLIIKPNFGCSTAEIYRGIKYFSNASKFNNY